MEKTIQYRLKGVDCAGCGTKIETALQRLDGVQEVSVAVASQLLTLVLESGANVEAEALLLVSKLGYGAVRLNRDKPTKQIGAERMHGERRADNTAGTVAVDYASRAQTAGDACDQEADESAGYPPVARSAAGDARPDEADGLAAASAGDAHDHGFEPNARWWQQRNARLVAVFAVALLGAWLIGLLHPSTGNWALIAAMLVGLYPIGRRAFAALMAGVPFSIESLMTVAAIGAVVIGAAQEAAMVLLLFLLGELLEGIAAGRARASIRKLADLVPAQAWVQRAGGVFEPIAAAQLQVGDVIRVRPGDRIAADGEVLQGVGSVNEAVVTGESVPRLKEPGQRVFAGTVNGESALLVTVSAKAADNTIARVVQLVEEAQQGKAPLARFIDTFARRYTPAIALLALLVACVPPLWGGDWGQWTYKALALLLIGCPCALVISTPAAVAAGLARGARCGLLMKGGAVLEAAGRLRVIAFDKTGTLTRGTPEVTDVWDADDRDTDDSARAAAGGAIAGGQTLKLAAALEAGSSHPLAQAVLDYAQGQGLAEVLAEDLGTIAGSGVAGVIAGRRYFLGSARAAAERVPFSASLRMRVEALAQEGKTVSVLITQTDGKDGGWRIVGLLAFRDQLRAEAGSAVERLQARGIRCLMLTGDTAPTANALAAELGIEVRAELLPEGKQQIVAELKQQAQGRGHFVAVVGDGINDAPALAAADLGIAMGSGTDVALETADAAILRNSVSDVVAMVDLSRATMRNIYQNITFAIGFKVVFLVTTLLGITGLWPAILADTGATVLVTLNAMRLLRWRPESFEEKTV